MDIEDLLFSANCALNEQIAKQLFDVLPERGPIMVIMDNEGHRWVSDPEKFSKLSTREAFWSKLCAKIDDGDEPVITQVDDSSIIGEQLTAENTKCGYLVMVLPQYNPESTLVNIGLIETILNQAGLIAKLVESHNVLREFQMKQLSSYTQSKSSSN
ncbi:MAG: hypothetical protein JW947_05905 [Sedimentisphaerales bacterium]|nr:hypothetical protein [Sedimentisphaerales bacterium]